MNWEISKCCLPSHRNFLPRQPSNILWRLCSTPRFSFSLIFFSSLINSHSFNHELYSHPRMSSHAPAVRSCSLPIPTWLWKSNLISQPPNILSFFCSFLTSAHQFLITFPFLFSNHWCLRHLGLKIWDHLWHSPISYSVLFLKSPRPLLGSVAC